MESPEEMKEKAELCPSCGTRNRVPSAARLGGTVRCARCQKDFARDDKVKVYNRELVCDKCAAFLEDLEKVTLPEATDEDLASPPPRSVFSGGLGCLAVLFFLTIPAAGVSAIINIMEAIAAGSVASCLDAVFRVAWFSFVIWVSVLFFRQKRLARLAIVALFIVEAFFLLLGVLSGHRDWTLLVTWTIVRIAMIMYLLLSKRVKETFVN